MINLKKIYVVLFTFLLIAGCAREEASDLTPDLPADTPQDKFFASLFSQCGETFIGESTFPDDPEQPLVDTELNATISTCTEEMIEIDLVRGGDTWHATWVLEMRDEGLHLSHDHLGDQAEDELAEDHHTGYGGYANERGSANVQYFPADEHTAEMIPDASTNVWTIKLNPDQGTLVYSLERNQEPRFRAELTKS